MAPHDIAFLCIVALAAILDGPRVLLRSRTPMLRRDLDRSLRA